MDTKGQTTVEFALAALVLFTFVFAIIDFAMMFYVNLTMQNAVREGARYAITGQTDQPGQGYKNGEHRKKAMIKKMKECAHGLYEKNANPQKEPTVSIVTPASAATFSNYTGRPVDDTGEPSDIIIVSLAYSWPLLTPILRPFFEDKKNYSFVVRATMRHEPWENGR